MPVPKQRKSKSKRAMRRANHDKLIAPNVIACAHCGEPTLAHHVCKACGHYKGKSVVEIREEGADEAEAQA